MIMTKNEIIYYQFAERIKSALIIGSKILTVLETLDGCELEGAKKAIFAFFDGLSVETGIALNATRMQEFALVDDKIRQVKIKVEEEDYSEAHATLGRAVSHATTACAGAMSTLMEDGLM
jgi:hypothetical protein